MRILSIETSCDETGVSIVDCDLENEEYKFEALANNLLSQVKLHAEYGGVFPSLAKREHTKAMIPLLIKTLREAKLGENSDHSSRLKEAQKYLDREPEISDRLKEISAFNAETIDAVSVTVGPGLAPALWVGVNSAKALATLWDKPIIPVNHMHGHIFSGLFPQSEPYEAPTLSLLVSGGHTEILKIDEDLSMYTLGSTRDDAIGEAFDKAARLLELGYPGGPEISKLASLHREKFPEYKSELFPRPMKSDESLDVSYSGLKTALLYQLENNKEDRPLDKEQISREFEDAALDVIVAKVERALEDDAYRSLVAGGGVIANKELQRRLQDLSEKFSIPLHIPKPELTTDNALMIAVASYVLFKNKKISAIETEKISAQANLSANEFAL
ncbi:MAG: tRNA (adenosine(37)-N6)-threonylcarbamoyltransferase complex transferase subunit TsaD [Candidatus Campbellbacteria bacterium]|nr:tRNA (adenosine(37)-N6)-threonylcarbamoyltransferase complex transferase subunit TsaD [Candidatus Campbellbacteria bacterium]